MDNEHEFQVNETYVVDGDCFSLKDGEAVSIEQVENDGSLCVRRKVDGYRIWLQKSDARRSLKAPVDIKAEQDALDTVKVEKFVIDEPRAQQLRDLNDALERSQADLREANRALSDAREAHKKDIELIGTACIEAAEENDFCQVYDNCVSDLNDEISFPLPLRPMEYDVTFYFRQTVTVTMPVGSDDDDVAREARQMDSYGENLTKWDESETPDVNESDN